MIMVILQLLNFESHLGSHHRCLYDLFGGTIGFLMWGTLNKNNQNILHAQMSSFPIPTLEFQIFIVLSAILDPVCFSTLL